MVLRACKFRTVSLFTISSPFRSWLSVAFYGVTTDITTLVAKFLFWALIFLEETAGKWFKSALFILDLFFELSRLECIDSLRILSFEWSFDREFIDLTCSLLTRFEWLELSESKTDVVNFSLSPLRYVIFLGVWITSRSIETEPKLSIIALQLLSSALFLVDLTADFFATVLGVMWLSDPGVPQIWDKTSGS